jgi:hypothetical protein
MREHEQPGHDVRRIEISRILGKRLEVPLVALTRPASPGFVAHTVGMPVLGYGDDAADAVEVLTRGIEQMCLSGEFPDIRARLEELLLTNGLTAGDAGGR